MTCRSLARVTSAAHYLAAVHAAAHTADATNTSHHLLAWRRDAYWFV